MDKTIDTAVDALVQDKWLPILIESTAPAKSTVICGACGHTLHIHKLKAGNIQFGTHHYSLPRAFRAACQLPVKDPTRFRLRALGANE